MSKRETFFLRCHEVTEFCLAHAGRCFGGWPRERVFLRIAGAAVQGNLIVVKDGDAVRGMAIAKPTEKGLFVWETVGDRAACAAMFCKARKRWPNWNRMFAYRRDKLVEFNPAAVRKFCLSN